MKKNIQEKTFEILYLKPEEWMYLRELARKTKTSPNSIKPYLKQAIKQKIIQKKEEKQRTYYKPNLESEKYLQQKRIYNLKKIYETNIIQTIEKNYEPEAIILFGSYSRGEDISTSDIDIAVITKTKKRINLNHFEKKLQRKIELSLLTYEEISKEFLISLHNGIVLKGYIKK